jgi:undecaprenyl-diphosphatase
MTFIQAILLGIIQGLTEFLPISSTAHLVLAPALFGWQFNQAENFVFTVLVQWGTLVAVAVYFWSELLPITLGWFRSLKPGTKLGADARLGWLLVLATLPALLVGWFARKPIEATLSSPRITAYFLLVTAALLVFAELVGKRKKGMADVSPRDALLIGVFQAFALLPGISRSGSTISGGMAANLRRAAAARFAFLLAGPVMVAAGVLALFDLKQLPNTLQFFLVVLAGFATAAVVGYAAIRWLLGYLAHRSLYPFAIYCAAIALLALWLL